MSVLKGVIFDFNGTLLWDTPYHNRAWNIFLEKYGIKLSDAEIRDKFHGKNNRDIFTLLFKGKLSSQQILKYASEKEAIYRKLIEDDDFQLAFGVTRMFNFCLGACIPMAIATSSEKENTDFYVERYKLKRWFQANRIVYNDYSFRGKPEPDIFVKAASRLFLHPSEIIVFEDSYAGIAAAEKFGAGKIIIVNSTHDNYSEYQYPIISNFTAGLQIIKTEIADERNQRVMLEI